MEVLTRVEQEKAYSNLELGRTLKKAGLSRPDAALATELVYGTIQRLNTLDFLLEPFVSRGLDRLEPWVRNLVRLSLYQIVYLERIPDHAAVNEAVNIARRKGHPGIAGMVNAVLRGCLRSREKLAVPDIADPIRRIALVHSHPEWLVERWIRQFGEADAEAICAANNLPPRASIRVNPTRIAREQLIGRLVQAGLEAEPSPLSASGIIVSGGGNLAELPEFREGLFSIQDESSMAVADAVAPEPGMKVLDCCAAPGGKTAHLAERMNDKGEVWANDVHPHKERLILDQASRLGLTSIRTLVSDAAELASRFPPDAFDRILLDAPCSGFGVIRRKPEIKWMRSADDPASLAEVQLRLLASVSGLVKPGGVVVYSTCTLEYTENEQVVRKFLAEHPEFEPDGRLETCVAETLWTRAGIAPGMLRILPHMFHTDGFFIARLRRKEMGSDR
jgi:16S rRNA (cytosine967-C5)-methyltransferase